MYARIVHIAATLWLALQLAAAAGDASMVELAPVHRSVWDGNALALRSDTNAALGLVSRERFMWSSSENLDEEATVVTMDVQARNNEFIIDMEKFDFVLDSVTCDEDSLAIVFNSKIAYLAAKTAWKWVNEKGEHSFVLSPSQKYSCDMDARHPWVISSADFDDDKLLATLDAIQGTWKDIADSYIIDYGRFIPDHDKRGWFDVEMDGAFTVDLSSTFPTNIFEFSIQNTEAKLTTSLTCENCGTHGSLKFAGHVEVGLGGVDTFELSVAPSGVSLNLTAVLAIEGELDTQVSPTPVQIVELPIAGFSIAGVIQFGPSVQVNAGIEFGKVSGKISVEETLAVYLQDSAIAKVDLAGDGDALEISGWRPGVDVSGPTVTGEIDTELKEFLEMNVGVGIEVLGFGLRAALVLKYPEWSMVLAVGSDPDGYCEGSDSETGIKLSSAIGSSLAFQGLKEVGGKEEPFFEVSLFKLPNLVEDDMCWPL